MNKVAMPDFNIDFNKFFSVIMTLITSLVAYFVTDEGLRAMLVLALNGLMNAVSIKAQTLNPDGSKIEGGEKTATPQEGGEGL